MAEAIKSTPQVSITYDEAKNSVAIQITPPMILDNGYVSYLNKKFVLLGLLADKFKIPQIFDPMHVPENLLHVVQIEDLNENQRHLIKVLLEFFDSDDYLQIFEDVPGTAFTKKIFKLGRPAFIITSIINHFKEFQVQYGFRQGGFC